MLRWNIPATLTCLGNDPNPYIKLHTSLIQSFVTPSPLEETAQIELTQKRYYGVQLNKGYLNVYLNAAFLEVMLR